MTSEPPDTPDAAGPAVQVDEEGSPRAELQGVAATTWQGASVRAGARFPGPVCQECPLLVAWQQVQPATAGTPATDDRPEWHRLSPRLRQVARLLAEGLSDRAIATQLQVSPRTTRDYSSQVLVQLSLHSRRQLILAAPPAHAHRHLPVVDRP